MTWTAALGFAFTAYALLTGAYVVLQNRRPQATLAWRLLFLALPGIGLVIFVLFGRDQKAFSRDRKLARQNLEANAAPLLRPMRARQDTEIERLEGQSPVPASSWNPCAATPTRSSPRIIGSKSSRTRASTTRAWLRT